MKNIKMMATASVLLTAVGVAACGPASSSHSAGASAGASRAKAIASSTAGQQVKQDIKRCIPPSGAVQLRLAHKILTDTAAHPNGSRAGLAACMGITPANRQPFENDVINAAEHGHLLTHSGRAQFFQVTLPAIAVKYAGKGTP